MPAGARKQAVSTAKVPTIFLFTRPPAASWSGLRRAHRRPSRAFRPRGAPSRWPPRDTPAIGGAGRYLGLLHSPSHPPTECLAQLLGSILDPPIRQGAQLYRIGFARNLVIGEARSVRAPPKVDFRARTVPDATRCMRPSRRSRLDGLRNGCPRRSEYVDQSASELAPPTHLLPLRRLSVLGPC
jgi:hypothetical protein